MRFGRTLARCIYPPWKDKYIDYAKLKKLLREDKLDEDGESWTLEDENRFCDEVFSVQLEKVARFQQERVDELKRRLNTALERLKTLIPDNEAERTERTEVDASRLHDLETELDDIMQEVNRLKTYSSDNYTGFLKIVKKHDRKRGDRYRVRPMMQLSLSKRPFNSLQAYTPLLNKLSIMYFAIRHYLEDEGNQIPQSLENPSEVHNGETYTAHKFWVHPDNLLELKTQILRRLPMLIYSDQEDKELNSEDSPSITSLSFDNKNFELYSEKSELQSHATSLRLRWSGPLNDGPQIFVEQKVTDIHSKSEESRFTIKSKYVKPFLDGEYAMEKTIKKMQQMDEDPRKIESFKTTVTKIQSLVREKRLSPVLRANYVRTAFQKPGNDRVRIYIDSDLAFVREDTLDSSRPCRDPASWHRLDIDGSSMSYPFKYINQGEVSKFPFAILDIKFKDDGSGKLPNWIRDLMASHLVHPVPRFSKFVQGVASLFEDQVNYLPFWLSDLEGDIWKNPEEAFEDEEQRRAQQADDAMVVGSLVGSVPNNFQPAQNSPLSRSHVAERLAAEGQQHTLASVSKARSQAPGEEEGEGSGLKRLDRPPRPGYGTFSSMIPTFSSTRSSMAKQRERIKLPEGVVEPKEWIRNAGELKVEPKVWLANERTFLKWQHICVLQGGLSVALYTAAGKDSLAVALGIVYLAVAVFAGVWGHHMLRVRRNMIVERSGKDFDNMFGPVVISVALMLALTMNFVLQYRRAFAGTDSGSEANNSSWTELR